MRLFGKLVVRLQLATGGGLLRIPRRLRVKNQRRRKAKLQVSREKEASLLFLREAEGAD